MLILVLEGVRFLIVVYVIRWNGVYKFIFFFSCELFNLVVNKVVSYSKFKRKIKKIFKFIE